MAACSATDALVLDCCALFSSPSVRVNKPDSENDFKTFTFDSVYPPGTEQKTIFDDCTKPIIDSVLNGYNGTLFCYGFDHSAAAAAAAAPLPLLSVPVILSHRSDSRAGLGLLMCGAHWAVALHSPERVGC